MEDLDLAISEGLDAAVASFGMADISSSNTSGRHPAAGIRRQRSYSYAREKPSFRKLVTETLEEFVFVDIPIWEIIDQAFTASQRCACHKWSQTADCQLVTCPHASRSNGVGPGLTLLSPHASRDEADGSSNGGAAAGLGLKLLLLECVDLLQDSDPDVAAGAAIVLAQRLPDAESAVELETWQFLVSCLAGAALESPVSIRIARQKTGALERMQALSKAAKAQAARARQTAAEALLPAQLPEAEPLLTAEPSGLAAVWPDTAYPSVTSSHVAASSEHSAAASALSASPKALPQRASPAESVAADTPPAAAINAEALAAPAQATGQRPPAPKGSKRGVSAAAQPPPPAESLAVNAPPAAPASTEVPAASAQPTAKRFAALAHSVRGASSAARRPPSPPTIAAPQEATDPLKQLQWLQQDAHSLRMDADVAAAAGGNHQAAAAAAAASGRQRQAAALLRRTAAALLEPAGQEEAQLYSHSGYTPIYRSSYSCLRSASRREDALSAAVKAVDDCLGVLTAPRAAQRPPAAQPEAAQPEAERSDGSLQLADAFRISMPAAAAADFLAGVCLLLQCLAAASSRGWEDTTLRDNSTSARFATELQPRLLAVVPEVAVAAAAMPAAACDPLIAAAAESVSDVCTHHLAMPAEDHAEAHELTQGLTGLRLCAAGSQHCAPDAEAKGYQLRTLPGEVQAIVQITA